jgi:ectoine hydroxylase-related dioxygenase (phytanoyl-CoA dioxygenase family)
VEDFCCWQENESYRRFIFESALGRVGAALMGSRSARLYHDHMLTKEPGTRARTPWHQDQPYYNISGTQNCSFWIPVDPVAREATLEFVAGSQRGPWLMPRSFMDAQAKWFPAGSLADLPDIEAHRADYRILGWQLSPGDAVCFHMLTLHAAGGVPPGQRRRVFSVRLLGDDVRHAPRRWPTSPAFPGVADVLAAGAPMEHPLFPLLWPVD